MGQGQARAFVCVVGGVGVCDCQLWERDPPREERRFGRKKRKSKRLKKESRSVEKWGGVRGGVRENVVLM